MRMTGSQTTDNCRIYPWPLRLSGNKAQTDQAARRGFRRWFFFDRVAEAASIQPRGIPRSHSRAALPRNCKGGEQHHHQNRPFRGMLVCADTGPNRERRRCLLTGTFRSNGVVPDDRSRNCADRRRQGSPVVRNTHQTEITRHDLNQQHRLSPGQGQAQSGREGPPGAAGRFVRRMGRFLCTSCQTCIENRIFLTTPAIGSRGSSTCCRVWN